MKLKALFAAMVLVLSTQVNASEFDQGTTEYDAPPAAPNYTEAEIQKKIASEMEVACQGNLCAIVGTDGEGSGWSVSFNVGYGNNTNGNGNNFYIGTDRTAANNQPQYNASITVTYKNYTCHSSLRVTPSIYRFVNTYMYNMVNSDGSTKRNFSPADQTVILFYTTMLNKVDNCKAINN